MESRQTGDRLRELDVELDEEHDLDDLDRALAPGRVSHLAALLDRAASAPLPTDLRRELERGLKQDLGEVRVHHDEQASGAAILLGAHAFTVGQSIYFGAGKWDAGSTEGRRLIAHEVAHTVQQRGAASAPVGSMRVSRPGDRHEQEAEAFASSFLQGGRGPALSPVSRGVVARAVVQRDADPTASGASRYRQLIEANLKAQAQLGWTAPPSWGSPRSVAFVQNVQRFQRDHKLAATGVLEGATWEALKQEHATEAKQVYLHARGDSPASPPKSGFKLHYFTARCASTKTFRWFVVDTTGKANLHHAKVFLDHGGAPTEYDGKPALTYADDSDTFRIPIAVPGDYLVVVEALDAKSGEVISKATREQKIVARRDVDYIAEVLKGIARGFAGSTASTLEGVAIIAKQIDLMGEYEGKEATDLATYKVAQAIKGWAEEAFPSDKETQKQFYVQVSQGIGSSLTFMVGGLGPRLLTKGATTAATTAAGKSLATAAPLLPVATLGAAAGAADSYSKARQAGFDDKMGRDAAKWGFLIGTTEIVPIGWLLVKLDRLAKGKLRHAVIEAAKNGAEDAAQEGIAQVGQNEVAHQLYEANRDWAGAYESGQVGAGSGGVTSFLTTLVAMAVGGRSRGGAKSPSEGHGAATQPAKPAQPAWVTEPTPPPPAADVAAKSTDLYNWYNEDANYDRFKEFREAHPAEPLPDLAFSGVSNDALGSIFQQGLLSGRARGAKGANADQIWFKSGTPFYADVVTLVMPADRLRDLGGTDTLGLAGQKDVMSLAHDVRPEGLSISEFAIVYSIGNGYVVPLHIPKGWTGPVGRIPPMELIPEAFRSTAAALASNAAAPAAPGPATSPNDRVDSKARP